MNKEELMDLDRFFCKKVSVGKAKAWASFFATDGIMITSEHNENIIGKENIEMYMERIFHLNGFSLTWEPDNATISGDSTLGITYGTYTRKYNKGTNEVIERGKYTTVWKNNNSEWEIILDIGN